MLSNAMRERPMQESEVGQYWTHAEWGVGGAHAVDVAAELDEVEPVDRRRN